MGVLSPGSSASAAQNRSSVRMKRESCMLVEHIDDALVVEVARGVVRQVAPQEMPLFRANSEVYRKDPQKALRGESGRDQILAFGAGLDVTLLTPVVLAVV